MGQLEDLSAPLAATKASVNKLQNDDGLESKIPDLQDTLAAILRATEEQTRATAEQTEGAKELSFQLLQNEDRVDELVKQNADLREAMTKQNAELRQDVLKQNAAILAAMQEQSRATERQTRAIERQTLAIEKLAAPGRPARESGKRKRVEGTSAGAGNQQETSATDSQQTSAAEKSVSSSLKGKGTGDAGEGTSTARGKKKKMKETSPAAAAPPSTTPPPTPQEMTTLPEKPVSSSLNDTGTEDSDSDSDSDEGTLAAQLQARIVEEKKMKAPAPSPAPAKDVLSVNATGSLEGTCTWTIPNFCTMKVDKDGGKSSDIFSIGGHKWKLYVYPMGRDSGKDNFVSLYLHLADDTKKLPKGWQVTVDSTFSLICQHDPEESHKEDGEDIFDAADKTWGWDGFIPLLEFYDVDNGFLVNDTMIIKAKMEVKAPARAPAPAPPKADVQNTKAPAPPPAAAAPEKADVQNTKAPSPPAPAKVVKSSNAASPLGGAYTWRIPHFSKLKVDGKGRKFSDVFSIGGHDWKLRIFPRGKGSGKDKSVSLALVLADAHGKVTADFSLSVICQLDPEKSQTKENTFKEFTCRAAKGYADFIPLADFYDPAKGFLKNDTVIIKAKIEVKKPAPSPSPAPPKADVQSTKAPPSPSAPSPAPAKVDVSVNAASPLRGAYTWRIPHFSKLKWSDWDRESSDTFSIGGHNWKMLVHLSTPPQGRSTRGQKYEKNKYLSLSLVLADTEKLPKDGKVTAGLWLSVTCQRDPEDSPKVRTKNTFTAHFNSDHWEWNNIIPLTDLRDPKRGYLVKDTVIIEAKIDVE